MTAWPPSGLMRPLAAAGDDDPLRLMTMQLFADSIEKIDTLLQEIRHLQINLIHGMRFRELHRILRFEESYIFGGVEVLKKPSARQKESGEPETEARGWSWLLRDSGLLIDGTAAGRLADAFVPVLPKPEAETAFTRGGPDDPAEGDERAFPEFEPILAVGIVRRAALAPIARELNRVRLSGRWDDAFDMSYELFMALQALKRNIVCDRLFLCAYGLRAVEPDRADALRIGPRLPVDDPRVLSAQFMFARQVIHSNLSLYVERLGDQYAHFEKALDIGSQENHRPITGRRREQGLYHYMLGERTRDLFVELSTLARATINTEGGAPLFRGMPVIIHRWNHHFASVNTELISLSRSFRAREDDPRIGPLPSFASFAINTSFWMPDRPDLQPVIAHEAAHCVLTELFGDMTELSLVKRIEGPLPELMRGVMAAAAEFGLDDESAAENPEMPAREIVADILAAVVVGPAYLFALVQEMLGYGLEQVAGDTRWRDWRDARRIAEALDTGIGGHAVEVQWHARIHAVADVIERTWRKEEDTILTDILVLGARECADALFDLISERVEPYRPGFRSLREDYRAAICDAVRRADVLANFAEFRRGMVGRFGESSNNGRFLKDRLALDADELQRDGEDEPLSFGAFRPKFRNRLAEFFIQRKTNGQGRALRVALKSAHTSKPGDGSEFERAIARHDPDTKNRLRVLAGALDPTDVAKSATDSPLAAGLAIALFEALYIGVKRNSKGALDAKRLLDEVKNQPGGASSGPSKGSRDTRRILDEAIGKLTIFDRFVDLPWQAALWRMMDLGVGAGVTGPRCIVRALSADCAPGRETTQLAIEYWSFNRVSTLTTLAEASRLVCDLACVTVDEATCSVVDMAGSNDGELRRALRESLPDEAGEEMGEAIRCIESGCRAMLCGAGWGGSAKKAFEDAHRANDERDATEKIAGHAADGLKAALRLWLGVDLDADFMESALREAIDERLHERGVAKRDERGQVIRSLATRKLIDDAIQQMRAIESVVVAGLHRALAAEKIRKAESACGWAQQQTARAGALQWLKLERGFPGVGFPIKPERRYPFADKEGAALKRATPQEVARDLANVAGAHYSAVAKFRERCERDKPPEIKDPQLVASAVADFLKGRLGALELTIPDAALRRAVAAHAVAPDTLPSDPVERARAMAHAGAIEGAAPGGGWPIPEALRPLHRREAGELVYRRRLIEIARAKLERLDRALGFDALPSMRFEPLRAVLLTARWRADRNERKDPAERILEDAGRAISRSVGGLRRFVSPTVSRQSLIDAHWFREGETPKRRKPGSAASKRFDAERASGAFYQEAPHDKDRANGRPPAVRRFATLGRYDYINVASDTPTGHIRTPIMDRRVGESAEEIYASPKVPFSRVRDELSYRCYFERRERAIALSLGVEPLDLLSPDLRGVGDPGAAETRDVLCFLSIRLDRRASRAAFIERLRRARRNWRAYRTLCRKDDKHVLNQLAADLHEPGERIANALKKKANAPSNPFSSLRFRRSVACRLIDALNLRRERPLVLSEIARMDPLEIADVIGGIPEVERAKSWYFRSQLQALYESTRWRADLPMLPLEAAGFFLSDGDGALLGEGWADVTLFVGHPADPGAGSATRDEWLGRGPASLYDIFALQHTLFQDYSVFRTEMFMRPVTLLLAATDDERFRITQAVRTREDRALDGMIQRMLKEMRDKLQQKLNDALRKPGTSVSDFVTVSHIPGRNDLEVALLKPAVLQDDELGAPFLGLSASDALRLLHDAIGAGAQSFGGGSEEIVTRVGFLHALRGNDANAGTP